MYMQTIPLKEHQLPTSNLSSLSLHVHSRNDSLRTVPFAFYHPEGLRTPTNDRSITPLKAGTALDTFRLTQRWVKAKRTPGGLTANGQTLYDTDTKFAQREVSRVHAEPESHLNNCCVKSAELLDILLSTTRKETK